MRRVTSRQVFDVLRDGRSYEHWVVGTRAIRAVDPGWPAPGARLHYTVGYGLLRKDDVTTSCAYAPDVRLELEAHAWPAGTAGIVLRVEERGDGVCVALDEAPRRGPARLLHNPVADLLIKVRNVETLRRLELQAQAR
jgi:hypothetical protein